MERRPYAPKPKNEESDDDLEELIEQLTQNIDDQKK
jgi:hypothetical protein